MIRWTMHNNAHPEMLGFIPQFLSDMDLRPAGEQFHEAYAHGGGWRPFGVGQWKLTLADSSTSGPYGASQLRYPGDPPFKVVAHTILHEGPTVFIDSDDKLLIPELVLIFEAGPWIVVKPLVGEDFEVSRMD